MKVSMQNFDRPLRLLHFALAVGVTAQLMLSAVMTVPAGPGLGLRDWHRAAFELHAKVGIFVATICALHWIWLASSRGRPQLRKLLPWIYRATPIFQPRDFEGNARRLAQTVHGLGLLAVTGAALCGIVNYLGYFMGVPIPRSLLHIIGILHISFGWLIAIFLLGHSAMACAHFILRPRPK